MERLYIVADKEIFEVIAFNGGVVECLDKTNWSASIPINRVERFCDKNGNHINHVLKNE